MKMKTLYIITGILAFLALLQVATLGFAEFYPPGGQGGP